MERKDDAAVCASFGSECLARHADGFIEHLRQLGYSCLTIGNKRNFLSRLGRWLDRREAKQQFLDEAVLAHFYQKGRRSGDIATGQQLVRYLRDLGCIPTPALESGRSAVDKAIADFDRFLQSERGLLPKSRRNYLYFVRFFLSWRFTSNVRLGDLKASDVHGFLLRYAQTKSGGTTRLVITALRSFLRYLRQQGVLETDLAAMVPSVARWSLAGLPTFLSTDEVERLPSSCNLSTPTGKRDRAILLLLARLGLRACEVVALTLDDVDWANGDLIVRGKGKRLARLPLPPDVGEALVEYLRNARPEYPTRHVFLRTRAPAGRLEKPSAVGDIVRHALHRAGLAPRHKGAHLLRHSLATNLLRHGASLGEIGQVLRHSQPDTTLIYAKVDIESLRRIAMPWPVGTP